MDKIEEVAHLEQLVFVGVVLCGWVGWGLVLGGVGAGVVGGDSFDFLANKYECEHIDKNPSVCQPVENTLRGIPTYRIFCDPRQPNLNSGSIPSNIINLMRRYRQRLDRIRGNINIQQQLMPLKQQLVEL